MCFRCSDDPCKGPHQVCQREILDGGYISSKMSDGSGVELKGEQYVDYFSRYPEVDKLTRLN